MCYKLIKTIAYCSTLGVLAAAGVGTPAQANDSVAGLEAGELVMMISDAVAMVEEDLYLSPSEVRVRYLFRNESAAPVTTLVAFPLPLIHNQQESSYGFSEVHTDPIDVVNFRLWVDGVARPVSIDARAIGETGRDVTDVLEKWHLPINFITSDWEAYERLRKHTEALPPEALDELRAAGALSSERWAMDGFYPTWSAQIKYYWELTFPPGVPVEVRHSYNPVPSAFVFGENDLEGGFLGDEVCMDAAFKDGVRRRLAKVGEYATGTGVQLDYILTTANTWRGPIGQFHLTVDKESTDSIVSLCRDGIRKTGATTFEWSAQGWTPQRDLSLLFFRVND